MSEKISITLEDSTEPIKIITHNLTVTDENNDEHEIKIIETQHDSHNASFHFNDLMEINFLQGGDTTEDDLMSMCIDVIYNQS